MKRLDAWQFVAWGLFLAAFVGAGAVPFDTLHRQVRVTDQGPTNSSDRMFFADVALTDGSARIAEALREVPKGSRVAVIYRLGSYQTLSAQMICHAAWSHGLRPFEVAAEAPDARDQVRKGEAAAAFSLDGSPPGWFPAPQVLSRHVSFSRFPPQ